MRIRRRSLTIDYNVASQRRRTVLKIGDIRVQQTIECLAWLLSSNEAAAVHWRWAHVAPSFTLWQHTCTLYWLFINAVNVMWWVEHNQSYYFISCESPTTLTLWCSRRARAPSDEPTVFLISAFLCRNALKWLYRKQKIYYAKCWYLYKVI